MPPIPVPPTPLDPAINPAAFSNPAKSLRGWQTLQQAIISDLPTAHRRAAIYRRAAYRALR